MKKIDYQIVKKQPEIFGELSDNDKFNILNDKFVENKIQLNDFLKESKNNHVNLTSVTSSIAELQSNLDNRYSNSDIEEKIETLKCSVSELQSNLDNCCSNSDIEEKIETLKCSVSELQSNLDNRYSNSEIEEKIKMETELILEKQFKIDNNKEKNYDSFGDAYIQTDLILKLLIDNILPKDFDYKCYRELNEDLKDYNELKLKKHYLLYGKAENRKYKSLNKNVPHDFNWVEYMRINIDFSKHFNDEYNATKHYLNVGFYENRMYKMSQLEDVNFFIYSGRKSGSTTLSHTCSNIENSLSIQIHNNEDYLYKYGQCKYNSIFELVENNMEIHETIYIIDSYRTPIEKKISSFFEDIDKYIPNYKDCEISVLTSYFNKKYIYGNKCTHIYTEDYEPLDEMLEHFKLSPLKKFNFDQQYELIKHKNLIFIKLRFNEIDKWDVLLSKIIGKDVTIIDQNKSENKNYYDVYENFKKNYRIPKEYLEKLKSDSRFKIYNSSLERIKYIKEWSSKSVII